MNAKRGTDPVEGGGERLHLVFAHLHGRVGSLVGVGLLDQVKKALLVRPAKRGHAVDECLVEVEVVGLQELDGLGLHSNTRRGRYANCNGVVDAVVCVWAHVYVENRRIVSTSQSVPTTRTSIPCRCI